MKYLKYFLLQLKKFAKHILANISVYAFIFFFMIISFWSEGYTLEDFLPDGVSLNPNDYCNLTEVDYTAVLDNTVGSVEITEYLTFDVHASSKSNLYKELWRELPEDVVDGLKVTYDVKSVTQILPNGTEIPYTETQKMYWEDYDYNQNSTMYWHHSDGDGRYPDNDESLLIYIPWTYRDKLTFKIVYTMNNAALKYKDCSELYLSMYSGNSIKKLESYKAQILIANELMPEEYHSFTFGTAKSRIPYKESATKNRGYYTFSIDLDKSDLKFNYHNRYIEFCLLAYGEDKHIFTGNAQPNLYTTDNALEECLAENTYYETQNRKYNNYKSMLLIISVFVFAMIVTASKEKIRKIKEKYSLFEPEVNYEYFREIPSDLDPLFASELVFMKDPFNEDKEKQEEYAALLLSLVRKKYVTLSKGESYKDWDDHNTIITIEPVHSTYRIPNYIDSPDYSPEPIYSNVNGDTGESLEPLSTSERLYFELLERHARLHHNSITVYQFQSAINSDYNYTNSFVRNIEKKPALECGVMQGYFQTAKYDEPQKEVKKSANSSLTLGLILLILVNGISYFTPMALSYGAYTILGIACLWRYLYLTDKASNLVLFTQYGVDEQAKWYGLYNFLKSDTLMHEKEIPDLVLWEKYLIYATAFGISEKVIKAIKINAVNLNIETSPILNTRCYIHSSRFHITSRSFGHSIHTSSRGGGFSGHGYGGGGRGGGGGGGGH